MCRLLVLTQLGRTLVRQHITTAGGGTGGISSQSAVHSGILVEGLGCQGFRVSGNHMCNCETRVIVRSDTVSQTACEGLPLRSGIDSHPVCIFVFKTSAGIIIIIIIMFKTSAGIIIIIIIFAPEHRGQGSGLAGPHGESKSSSIRVTTGECALPQRCAGDRGCRWELLPHHRPGNALRRQPHPRSRDRQGSRGGVTRPGKLEVMVARRTLVSISRPS